MFRLLCFFALLTVTLATQTYPTCHESEDPKYEEEDRLKRQFEIVWPLFIGMYYLGVFMFMSMNIWRRDFSIALFFGFLNILLYTIYKNVY